VNDLNSPELPAYALFPITLILIAVISFQMMRWRSSPAAQFVLFAVGFRYFLSAFHQITFLPLAGGLTINALGSVLVTGIGLFVINWRDLGPGKLWPFYLVIAAIVISGLVNFTPVAMIGALAKWGYLIVVMLASLRALREIGERAFFSLVLWGFAGPMVQQWASVVLGVAKASENDGSASYIGGYNHEAAFSVVLVTGICVAFLGSSVKAWVRAGIIVIGVIGLILANHRTTMLAASPLVAGFVTLELTRLASPRDRPLFGILAFLFLLIGAVAAVSLFAERFADLDVIVEHGGAIFKAPTEFTTADRDLMSGRLYIWSVYVTSYLSGGDAQLLFGQGPDSWQEMFRLYAHNTLVSFLYEYGVFGVSALLVLWFTMIGRVAAHAAPDRRWRLLCAHLAFLIVNQATMGHWLIEGQIFYALLCGHSFYCTEWRRRPAPIPAFAAQRAQLNPELARLQRSTKPRQR
jgi:hypothetical protein